MEIHHFLWDNYGKSICSIGDSSKNGSFSIHMLVYQSVRLLTVISIVPKTTSDTVGSDEEDGDGDRDDDDRAHDHDHDDEDDDDDDGDDDDDDDGDDGDDANPS